MELTPNMDFIGMARACSIPVGLYWVGAIAPAMAAVPKDSNNGKRHVVKRLQERACKEVKSIVHFSVETKWFAAFLNNTASTLHTSTATLRHYGVSCTYTCMRMMGHLERHIAKHSEASLPQPLAAYIAALVPRISRPIFEHMLESGEYPVTLQGFQRAKERITSDEELAKYIEDTQGRLRDVNRKRTAAIRRATTTKRWAEPLAQYKVAKALRHQTLLAAHRTFLSAPSFQDAPSLKAFAQHVRQQHQLLSPHISKKLPNPVGLMAYIAMHLPELRSSATYDTLRAQATAYAMASDMNEATLIKLTELT